MKLTEKRVAALAADPTGKRDVSAWDESLPGFGVRVKPSGSKSYVLWYRTRHSQKRLLTIGPASAFRAEQARELAREHLVQIKKGADPVQERKQARNGETVADLCGRYLKEHAERHKKASSLKSDRRIIRANIEPELGRKQIAGVSSADIARLHAAMHETPYEANRTMAVIRKMFVLAETWGLRPPNSNPCKGVKPYREQKRERFFSADELSALGAVLAEAQRENQELPACIAAIRLLALTGCRVSEILSLTWDRVDLQAGLLRLADAKAGARNVPLGAAAIALLSELPRDGSAYVVPGARPDVPLSIWTLEGAWQRIRRLAEIDNARLHDLRHTVGTYAGQAGLNAFIVRDLLGHKTLAMTGRYVERDANPLRAAADVVSGRIAAAMSGTKDGEVVPLQRALG